MEKVNTLLARCNAWLLPWYPKIKATIGQWPIHSLPDNLRNSLIISGGAMGIRTPDLLNAIEALYQLSYDPVKGRASIAALEK